MARSNTKIRESSKEILSNSFFLCCNLNHSNMPIWNDPLYLPWMCDLYEWLKAKFCVVPVPLVKLLQKSLEKTPKTRGWQCVMLSRDPQVEHFLRKGFLLLLGSARLSCDKCRCFEFCQRATGKNTIKNEKCLKSSASSRSNGKSRLTGTYI